MNVGELSKALEGGAETVAAPTWDYRRALIIAAAVGTIGLWAYWDTLEMLLRDWRHDLNYSVGQLVPVAALYLLWCSRDRLRSVRVRPCWWGVGVLVAAQGVRLAGLLFLYESAERYSIILTLAGGVLLIAGWRAFGRLRWILAFTLLMIPLPGRIHNAVSGPLQDCATAGAVFMLEVSGVSVVREGHTMWLDNSVSLAVAEACSGLRMLTAFVVVAATLAGAIARPRWQKAVVLVSSIPVAIVCNLVRLFVTAHLYLLVSGEAAERFFHDFAGLTMMPLAVGLLAGELWLMNKLIIPDRRPVAARAPL